MTGNRPNNSLTPQGKALATFSGFITGDAMRGRINQMMSGEKGNKFITSIVSTVTANPALAECDHMSIFSSAMLGESLGLSPSQQLGQFYMVPFKDKKNNRVVATFVLGYKGYIQLAIRSGYYKKLNVIAIKEGELVSYDPLNEDLVVELIQDDAKREEAETIGYYAMFEYLNGFRKTMFWSKKKMQVHADKYSAAYNLAAHRKLEAGEIPHQDLWKYSSFWYKDFDGMAFKTMLRQIISKWGIMSVELQQAMESDNAFISETGPRLIDTPPVPIEPTPVQPTAHESTPPEDPEGAFFADDNGEVHDVTSSQGQPEEEPQTRTRPTKEEIEQRRADAVKAWESTGQPLEDAENAVNGFSSKWTTAQCEKVVAMAEKINAEAEKQ